MKEQIIQFITNPMFLSCLSAAVLAQAIKVILNIIHKDKKKVTQVIFETGGMPSSHSAVVTALTISAFMIEGVSSLSIAILIIAGIVIMDAAGVRYSTGQISIVVNKMIKSLNKKKMIPMTHIKEILGHTPVQVFVGCCLGIVVGVIINMVF